ncbi:MAG: hypothetical protein H0W90_07170 [Actinobacteria bacterium]|nr:hypothetical protein [Actinomycetota bacterium]
MSIFELTNRGASKIIVLDGGRIVEEGSHQELLACGGEYANLVHLQLGASDSPLSALIG